MPAIKLLAIITLVLLTHPALQYPVQQGHPVWPLWEDVWAGHGNLIGLNAPSSARQSSSSTVEGSLLWSIVSLDMLLLGYGSSSAPGGDLLSCADVNLMRAGIQCAGIS